FSASAKSTPKKKNTVSSKKQSQKKYSKIAPKGKKSLKARKKQNKQIAQETPQEPKPGNPMFKVTPLDDGKFLIEPMESSHHQDIGLDQLSLIKKPIFEENMKAADDPKEGKDLLAGFPLLLVDFSKQLLGKAYRLGGNGQGNDGIDCSGFMKKIYQSVTLNLPHSSREQAKFGALVTTDWDISRLRIGDLLFFKRNRGSHIGHTGMYIGEGKMIHSSSKKGVIITNLMQSDYYNRNFAMARRLFIIDDPQVDQFKSFRGNLYPEF
ncbi:MAG TPA: C40 family peptidase, partial [Thermodesulfobacteriota bacterium]|nr:C40 family peptidase [Thermodesulfobacteriota bacterium]